MIGSRAAADAYHAARGNADWTSMPDSDKDAALARALTWLDARYGDRFSGRPVGDDVWPRENAFDSYGRAIPDSEVPVRVEHALYEAALREGSTPGSLETPERIIEREKIGELETKYADLEVDRWVVIEGLLRPYLLPLPAGYVVGVRTV